MKIAIIGLGYVGFTGLCCMASQGYEVVGFDVSPEKVDGVRNGVAPITEPQVQEMLSAAAAEGRVSAHQVLNGHLDDCDMAIVCVGTPSGPDGAHDMRYIAGSARDIAEALRAPRETPMTVVYRSTVRPGTMSSLVEPIFRDVLGEAYESRVELVYNPEFLREGTAVADYFAPPKIVIGTRDGAVSRRMKLLYAGIDAPVFVTGFPEAEITKFVDNTWHATKVAFANEIGRICLDMGVSAAKVHEVFVSDTKLNVSPYYLRPGGAFGGSCLPKDVRALQHLSSDAGVTTPLIDALIRSNEAHKQRLFRVVTERVPAGAHVLVAGVAFKADTDDLRESPNLDLIRRLLRAGYRVSLYDPAVSVNALVGANLGYALGAVPEMGSLLIPHEEAVSGAFDLTVITNATGKRLGLSADRPVLDLSTIT
jgi:GDP-mannose 6-dehydrogenase